MVIFSLPLVALIFLPALLLTPFLSHPTPHHLQQVTQGSNALISTPLGVASVHNNCTFPVHSDVVHSPRPQPASSPFVAPEEIYTKLVPGENVSHTFMHDPGMGISWKLWSVAAEEAAGHEETKRAAAGPIQFEYTWSPTDRKVSWDLSMIDAAPGAQLAGVPTAKNGGATEWRVKHPFADYGLSLQPHRKGVPVVPAGAQGAQGKMVAQSAGECGRVDCPAGEITCRGAYNAWNDWGQQHDCSEDVDLAVTLCG